MKELNESVKQKFIQKETVMEDQPIKIEPVPIIKPETVAATKAIEIIQQQPEPEE